MNAQQEPFAKAPPRPPTLTRTAAKSHEQQDAEDTAAAQRARDNAPPDGSKYSQKSVIFRCNIHIDIHIFM